MEASSLEETQKVGSYGEEEKEATVEEIKSTVDSGQEVAADDKSGSAIETQVSEAITEISTISDEQGTQIAETTELVSEKVEETTEVPEVVVESVELTESSAKELGDGTEAPVENLLAPENVEIQLKENPEEDLLPPEETTPVVAEDAVKRPLEESTSELSSVVPTETTRETEAVETIKDLVGGEESRPHSLEDNDGSSLPQTDLSALKSDEGKAVPATITEAVTEKIEETKLPTSDLKTEESLVIHDASKEDASTAETTSTTMQDRNENPNIASATRRNNSCGSCCGILELLTGVNR